MGALELSRVRCRLVGFSRVASKVTCLPIKPDRVRKYLGGTRYQYTPLYPESVSGPGGSTTAPKKQPRVWMMQSLVWNIVWRRCRPQRSIWVLRRMEVTMSQLEREMTTMPSGLGSSGRFNNRWGSLFSLLLFLSLFFHTRCLVSLFFFSFLYHKSIPF